MNKLQKKSYFFLKSKNETQETFAKLN